MSDQPQCVEWFKGTLCIAFKKEYIFQDIETGTVTELFPLEAKSVPLIRLLTDDILLMKEGTVFNTVWFYSGQNLHC